MKKISVALLVCVFLAVTVSSVWAYETHRGPTGVVIFDEDNALRAFTLISAFNETSTYLIDMKGYIRHQWDFPDTIPLDTPSSFPATSTDRTTDTSYTGVETASDLRPGLHCRLLVDGNLLRGYRPSVFDAAGDEINLNPAGGAAGGVFEVDPDGNLEWFYILKDVDQIQHHTFYRVEDPTSPYNGNTFILGWELISEAEALAEGRNPTTVGPEGVWPDFIREVNPAKETVWEWRVWDHLGAADPAKFDVNAQTDPVVLNNQDWTHGNTVEYNSDTGYVIINFRNWGEFFVIDHDGTYNGPADPDLLTATAAGDIMFRWGNPGNYGAGELPTVFNDKDQEIWGEHCVVWLGVDATNDGTPGNILIFDNGWNRVQGNRSRSVEITATGIGGDPADWLVPGLGGQSPEVWAYASGNESAFYTAFQGGTQRLYEDPVTGEHWTFVTSTGEAQLFQVYHDPAAFGSGNTVVWDFIMPTIDAEGNRRCYHTDGGFGANNMIHRAHQYLSDYPGLADYKLNSVGHIAGDCSQMWDLWDTPLVAGEEPAPLTGWGFSGLGIGGGGQGGGAGGGSGGY